jgi:hypothetical protein
VQQHGSRHKQHHEAPVQQKNAQAVDSIAAYYQIHCFRYSGGWTSARSLPDQRQLQWTNCRSLESESQQLKVSVCKWASRSSATDAVSPRLPVAWTWRCLLLLLLVLLFVLRQLSDMLPEPQLPDH